MGIVEFVARDIYGGGGIWKEKRGKQKKKKGL